MSFYHFCHTLFIISKSPDPVHTQAEEITQGCDHPEVGVNEGHFRRLPITHGTIFNFVKIASIGQR